jgi:hypothetical protein
MAVDLSSQMRKAAPVGTAVAALFAGQGAKVKQMRAFADG